MNLRLSGISLPVAAIALAWLSLEPAIAVALLICAYALGYAVVRVPSSALRMLAVVPVISPLAFRAGDQADPWQLVSMGLLMAVLAGPSARTNHESRA